MVIPVAVLSKSQFCDPPVVGMKDSIPTEGMNIFLVFVVQVVGSAKTWSFVQRCPTGYVCLIVFDLGDSAQGGLGSIWAVALGKKNIYIYTLLPNSL